jgi:hypothetical protein
MKEASGVRDSAGRIRVSLESLDAAPGDEDEGYSCYDYIPADIPDPSDEANAKLLAEMAVDALSEALGKITDPVRVALAARTRGVSLAHPQVGIKAGRSSTQLSAYLQGERNGRLPALLNEIALKRLPDEDDSVRVAFRAALLKNLIDDNEKWLARPENRDFLCFLQAEGD